MKTLTSVLSWITDPKKRTVVLFGTIAILCFLLFRSCGESANLRSQLEVKDNNINALRDTVREEKTKNGELQFVKGALVADMKELKQLNADLYNEVKNQRQQLYYVAQLTASIRDSLKKWSPKDSVGHDPGTGADFIAWNFDTTGVGFSRKLNGRTFFKVGLTDNKYVVTPMGSSLDNFQQDFLITTGLKESATQKGMLEIFVRSSYPGMTFPKIEGAVVNPEDFKKYLPSPKAHKWVIGPSFGVFYGLSLENQPTLKPCIGVGLSLTYKLIGF